MKRSFTQIDMHGNNVDLLALSPLDDALEAMHFAFRGLIRDADRYLESHGLTRVHHRMLYVLARRERTTIGELYTVLGVSKQALHRPLKRLLDESLVEAVRDADVRRYKLLTLTQAGRDVEKTATGHERAAIEAAFAQVDDRGCEAWYRIMAELARRA